MEQFDPNAIGTWRPDILSASEFLAEYEAVEALIEEAEDGGNTNLLELVEEKLSALERENPNGVHRLNRDRLTQLDKNERRTRLKIGQAAIRSRKARK